jgi:hypothetical protein
MDVASQEPSATVFLEPGSVEQAAPEARAADEKGKLDEEN